MITIFTPTYNRLNKLKNLAKSLECQTNKDFEWLIVDDGSTDQTEAWINKYEKESSLNITYIRKSNGGKHSAHNVAVERCQGEWFICVDSDDTLVDDAIETIVNLTSANREVIGYVFVSAPSIDSVSKSWKKIDGKLVDIIDMKELYNIVETAIVIKQSILMKQKFPIFYRANGTREKFCPEGVLYNQLMSYGKFLAINKLIYIRKYQEDGLTNNIFSLWKQNINGVFAELNSRYLATRKYSFGKRMISHIKCILNINALCLEQKESIMKHTPSKRMSAVLFLPSILFKYMRF